MALTLSVSVAGTTGPRNVSFHRIAYPERGPSKESKPLSKRERTCDRGPRECRAGSPAARPVFSRRFEVRERVRGLRTLPRAPACPSVRGRRHRGPFYLPLCGRQPQASRRSIETLIDVALLPTQRVAVDISPRYPRDGWLVHDRGGKSARSSCRSWRRQSGRSGSGRMLAAR